MLDLTSHWAGILSLVIFAAAYVLVVLEETTHMRKSKPVMLAAGLIWMLIGIAYALAGRSEETYELSAHIIEEYGELFLFLLVAITYVNTLEERRGFEVLRAKLVGLGLSYRGLFLLTGGIAFLLSGILDNLTTALVMGTVVMALGSHSPRFVTLGCISIVVAANAGGAFTPFGDITTLMVWQKGKLEFFEFFSIFVPSLVNWLVPAAILYFAVPHGTPVPHEERVRAKPGALGVAILFGLTIATAVSFKNFLHLPPALGMMLGLGYLQIWSYLLKQKGTRRGDDDMVLESFHQIQRVEWDTLLFFFGIIFAVGGLGVLGYLTLASQLLYTDLGPTSANVIIGALSAIVDNIPLMFAVLTMDPQMSHGQWLLITLTCGVGGSMLSIGSAAGVALMGQAKGAYTFFAHLKWTWAIALGYLASIAVHLVLNAHHF
ncbi:sodium:proton antiporter NhaD [Cereibacter sphaeroides]|uniref:sodium:proton antiporter NhaD n=1 Tax=Cereibacter sphaeroides TaxID=1063 RepID=UPI001F43142C|nr:sodium:proton antiporter NhaD [Cereibacter sphaeroides]MCE6951205.1 sodium:proton antiporter NhaD [Cereibacter sphaeroides]MCE6958884.1 sodium:proton antiporter NhaD [Cereibacter sphaeroides]MCE6968885.1 sodium:proton antiporter NhaD [Cereibacter sphaeroides]MCE6973522.1 sodium:proton antiporter NhaD [Cereibacter sphaeroides]